MIFSCPLAQALTTFFFPARQLFIGLLQGISALDFLFIGAYGDNGRQWNRHQPQWLEGKP
jgi:hypothetical protein